MRRLMISAMSSGSGKTIVTCGLLALLKKRGYHVRSVKCGPDYIDTKFHSAVCGRPSVNLDTFMASPDHVLKLYEHYSAGADICIVEGMMGLFDGYDKIKGSSAEIAGLLRLPVVLVVDARSAAYSTAALLSGFLHFSDTVHIAGVIFNKVGSSRHRELLSGICDDLHTTCFGYLPKDPAIETGSRYLGLDFSGQHPVNTLSDLLEQHIEWKKLLSL